MLERGDQIGDYTLVRFLGRGQFGEVWLAEKQLQFSKRKFQHALKFLFNLGDEINLKSAEAEIDTWIEASGHPNVMSVLDMLIHNDHIIIASEFAEGGSLKNWLSRSDGKAPSYEKALEMMTGILNGIEHLHSRNVVHRDLKPDNILLQNNFPRITDFGISRIVSAGSMSTVAMGSPFYMSPESFDGSKSTQTDIWSAGVILYEMLTGEHPYRAETIYGLVSAIRQAEPKPLPEFIPPDIRKLVDTALQKDLKKRYQTAQDMRSAIELEIYNLKLRVNSQNIDPPTLADVKVNLDPAATLVNEYFRDSLGNISSPDSKKSSETIDPSVYVAKTEAFSVEESLGSDLLPEIVRESALPEVTAAPTPEIPAPPIYEVPAPPAESPAGDEVSERARSAVEKFNAAIELEFQSSTPTVDAVERPVSNVPAELADSGVSTPKRPLMVIGGVGGALALGGILLVLGIIALFFVGRAIYFRASGDNANAVSANANSQSIPSTPTAPPGMVYVPGGEFMMGNNAAELTDEKPAHSVTVKPFFMDIYEVKNEQYAEFVKDTGHHPPQGWKNNVYLNGQGNYPVVGVNWTDAVEFAKWKGRRLPTEEEWEFAARGKDGRLYPWGNEWKTGNANAEGSSRSFTEVGKFEGESPYGIYDMVGNAWEWTASDFKAYPSGGLSPMYEGKSNLKSIRGNDFEAKKNYATVTYRLGWAATGAETYNRLGFRCVKDVGN